MNIKQSTYHLTQKIIKIVILILLALVISAVGFGAYKYGAPYITSKYFTSNNVSVTTTMVLEKILQISDLSTVQTNYNSVVRVNDPANYDTVLYYISYEAIVSAGIDFSLVDLTIDHENKTLTITLPQSEIQETNVDISSIDYMFIDSKSNTETVTADAYQLCKNDVAIESENIDAIKELAYDNAVGVLTALTVPFMQKLGDEYILVIA